MASVTFRRLAFLCGQQGRARLDPTEWGELHCLECGKKMRVMAPRSEIRKAIARHVCKPVEVLHGG